MTEPAENPATIGAETIDVARAWEPERYLAATLAAEAERPAAVALAAYAADLRRIVATSTQPMLGEIRLQWWRDSLEAGAAGTVTGSPIADAVGTAVRGYRLPVALLAAMTEARAWDLYDDPMPDEAAFASYVSKTEGIAFELALRVAGVAPPDAARLAAPAGVAFGITRLLADLPRHLAAARQPFPPAVMAAHGVDAGSIAAGQDTPATRVLLAAMAERAAAAARAATADARWLTRSQAAALLPLAAVPPYLAGITRPGRNPLREPFELAPLRRVWRIGVRHLGRWR